VSAGAVLVTGFPALRALHVVRELLAADSGRSVIALVHPERRPEAELRAAELETSSSRLELIEGNAAAIDFGLSGAAYSKICQRVQIMHASYSVTDANVSDALAHEINVGATREALELSEVAPNLTRLVFYSSVFVSGKRAGCVREDELDAGQAFRAPVERTLAIGERMLRRSKAPWLVLRSGHLLGDTELGRIEHISGPDALMLLVASLSPDLPVPVPSAGEVPLALTPVDYLARLGVFAAERVEPCRTLHVLAPDRVTLADFLTLVAEGLGRQLERGFNLATLTRALIGNPAARLLPQNARSLLEVLTSSAEYATEMVDQLTAAGAPRCPPLASYLGHLLDHLRERLHHGNLAARRTEAPFLVA
jgi:thioester reductase-like protein